MPPLVSAPLARRDALLSRAAGVSWPYGVLLDRLGLTATADVLDIGAGEGQLLRELQRRGHSGRLTGIDPRPGEGVQAGTADALPSPDAQFDVVIFLRVLGHLPDSEVALAEARRVLRPGGQVVVAANGHDHLRAIWTTLGQRPAPSAAGPLDVYCPVLLDEPTATELAEAYGSHWPGGVVSDTLHLQIWAEKKP